MLPITPRGFKDVLPQEARWREDITSRVRALLDLWGYAPIETPTLEVLEVLEQAGSMSSMPFRLFDTDNQLLVLRPDVTLPLARLVAARLSPEDLPLRLRYVQRVFREEESLRAQAREFTQVGVELIGIAGPWADAEVVQLFIEALDTCGLRGFTVSLCTVAVLNDLLDAAVAKGGADESWRREVLAAFHASNLVRVERLADDPRVNERFRLAVRKLFAVNGGREAIESCRALVGPLGCGDGLDALEATWQLLEALGSSERARIDFSVMCSFDYYTGLVFEAYAPGSGSALGSGGRYDRTLAAFGHDAPAAGCAFCLETVMHALDAQGSAGADASAGAGAGAGTGTAVSMAEPTAAAALEAFAAAAALRATGTTAQLTHTTPKGEVL
ncbi:MAG: ATP phosphoribosyltransferase regulatory subunit [Coriobacteriales bacterium]|jgi:ATP phosphoribosyltransferase regulatory subunit|nr:ATP phosphoribosyltransferase regulatory subunit [Coriobacteriales bacterium]